jgi:DNA invertase Pin-like site-specific DNA recombinase
VNICDNASEAYVAIYHRSAVAGGPSASPKLERCQDYCLSKWGGHGVVFDDTGLTGRPFERPSLLSLMTQARAGSTKIIVVHDFGTLGRDLFDIASPIENLLRAGVDIHAVALGGPVKSAVPILLADEEREVRLARLKAGRERAKRARERQES